MALLRGKGLWAHRVAGLDRAIEIAPQLGATHILFKVGQGALYYPKVAEAADRIKSAGLVPFAWMFLLLDDPEGEARLAVRAFEDGYEGFVFDTEADRCRNRFGQASHLGQYLRVSGVKLDRLYNCSYPTISQHRDLPYDQMNEFCKGGLMPMSYGTYFAPGSSVAVDLQARRVIDEWTYGHYEYWSFRWGYHPPLYPVLGPYHDEYGSVRMGPDEFQVWLNHLARYGPTFFSIFTASVIEEKLFPLIHTFALGETEKPTSTPTSVEVVSSAVGFLNVRPTPSTELPPVGRVDHATVLEVLEPEIAARTKLGKEGEWLKVRTPDGVEAYAAAWYLRLHRKVAESGLEVEVGSTDLGFLNVRPTPSTIRPPVTRVDTGDILEVLEPEESAREKIGKTNRWLYIRTPDGSEGCVAARHVRLLDKVAGRKVPHVVVHSSIGLNVRRGPGTDTSPIWRVVDRTVLEVREDQALAGEKVGKDRWLRIRTPSLREGYVNGLYVRSKQLADKRMSVRDADLPRGHCAWIFGIHAADSGTPADFRFLFEGKHKTGWVLFTEAVGIDPNHSGGHDYATWSHRGYGVIVRLNNGYEPNGTLPVRAKYPDFARACARYVRNSNGCSIWVIGNEQNNVREHPGGTEHPIEHITPEMYAEAFNLVRQHIKAVQPNAIVVPGALDPYNTYPWAKLNDLRSRPLDYFKRMLGGIDDLDGVALHAYTHWMDASLVTRPTIFQDAFLQPGTPKEHYYDFQAYRPFAAAIPEKWRDRPIYVTESNHWVALEHRPGSPVEEKRFGWVNKDKGWVQAAYKEIHRWNSAPHAQQIHCLLLYRWTGDAWALKNLSEVQKDFRKALDNDYRWRQ